MFHVMWAGSVPCHVTGLFHVMWTDTVSYHMDSVSCHVDGQCFMSCGWTVFYVMWMDTI